MATSLTDRDQAIRAARALLAQHPMILDTETTRLDGRAEICQIAAISSMNERVLVDTLVKPRGHIPTDATRVHGIMDADVNQAPRFSQIMSGNLGKLLDDASIPLCLYNAEYDLRLLDQSPGYRRYRNRTNVHCVMNLYAQFFGEWNGY